MIDFEKIILYYVSIGGFIGRGCGLIGDSRFMGHHRRRLIGDRWGRLIGWGRLIDWGRLIGWWRLIEWGRLIDWGNLVGCGRLVGNYRSFIGGKNWFIIGFHWGFIGCRRKCVGNHRGFIRCRNRVIGCIRFVWGRRWDRFDRRRGGTGVGWTSRWRQVTGVGWTSRW